MSPKSNYKNKPESSKTSTKLQRLAHKTVWNRRERETGLNVRGEKWGGSGKGESCVRRDGEGQDETTVSHTEDRSLHSHIKGLTYLNKLFWRWFTWSP